MCADAGDEEAAVIRYHDKSLIEVSDIPERLQGLLKRLDYLFVGRGAAKCPGTYTYFALEYLSRQRLIKHYDNTVRKFGGVQANDEMINRCFHRMSAWVRLVVTSLEAEFPSYEVLSCAAAFALHPAPSKDDTKRMLLKIAQTFNLDPQRLQDQHQLFSRSALRCCNRLDEKMPLRCLEAACLTLT